MPAARTLLSSDRLCRPADCVTPLPHTPTPTPPTHQIEQFWMSAWELYGFARQAASLEAQARQPGLKLLTLRFEVGGAGRD